MTIIAAERRYTPDELVTLRGAEHCELVDGRLVEKKMGAEADWIGIRLGTLLSNCVLSNNLGWVFGSESGYQCFGLNGERVRKPDVSFVTRERLPRIPKGHIPITPDLAAEVVSPNDLFSEVQVKVEEYLAAGVPLVWILDPETRTVEVYQQDGSVRRLRAHDILTGGTVLREFSCQVSELFPPLEATET